MLRLLRRVLLNSARGTHFFGCREHRLWSRVTIFLDSVDILFDILQALEVVRCLLSFLLEILTDGSLTAFSSYLKVEIVFTRISSGVNFWSNLCCWGEGSGWALWEVIGKGV